jgi:hypothetical protein
MAHPFDQEITMNAERSFLRATMASASLATAIALAFAMSTPAQAQYGYPGTASSSARAAHISPVRAGASMRSGYLAPTSSARHGNSNPSMQPGEACPPGSQCAHPQTGGGSGASPSSNAYGARESYGATPTQSAREANAVRPVATGGRASVSPTRAGGTRGALNYGTSQSAANFRSTMNGQQGTGPATNVTGQQTSVTGPDGKQINMGNQTSFTGTNGKKQTLGGGPDLNHLGGGYGHQKGGGMNMGGTTSYQNGSGSMTRTGSAPGMASANGMNMGNGGHAGASDSFSELNQEHNPFSDGNGKTTSDHGTLQFQDGKKFSGTDSDGLTWNRGKPWNGPDGDGGTYQNGNHIVGVKNKDTADTGPDYGGGELVNGAGNVVRPGQKPGSDAGGGQGQDAGASGGGTNRNNATGGYIVTGTYGQDAPVKPKEKGVLKANYNGKLGVTDPQRNGGGG